jgi:acyl carrier protein
VKEIEKGPSGKIRLEAARRRFEESRQGSVASSDAANDVETRVLQLAADTFRLHAGELNRDSSIENTAGWDSLGHLSLLLAAEQAFGVRFSAREIMQIDSIRKLVELCAGKAQS